MGVLYSRLVFKFALAGLLVLPCAAQSPRPPKPLTPGAKVVPLWPAGHPTLKNTDREEVWTYTDGQPNRVRSVVNVHNPSIELHPAPKDKAVGTALILAPGGGNRQLVVGSEGTDIVPWANGLGMSCFILRYRLQPYTSAGDALSDTLRAIRMVRANAKEWGVDPTKIGVMGFSAGGEQAALAALFFDEGDPAAKDPLERVSSRPDFDVMVYAGWRSLDMSNVPDNAPPSFFTSAGVDDAFHARQTVELYSAMFEKKIPVELHIYGHGGHGGGIKPRDGIPFGTWQERFVDWAVDLGYLKRR